MAGRLHFNDGSNDSRAMLDLGLLRFKEPPNTIGDYTISIEITLGNENDVKVFKDEITITVIE